MNFTDNTKNLLINHARRYPRLELADVFKFLHQSSLGCEHLVSSCDFAISYIKKEAESMSHCERTVVEPLDGDYSRVHLSFLSHGLSPETLGRLFFLSAKKEEQGIDALSAKLSVAEDLILNGELPFSYDEFVAARNEWQSNGYPAIHHSEAFRSNYHPAYRVISNEFVPYLLLFSAIDKKRADGNVRLAIDIGDDADRSAVASVLSQVYSPDDVLIEPSMPACAESGQAVCGIDGKMKIYLYN